MRHEVLFEPGRRIGNLRVERELGHGAFGRVFLAEDTLIGRPVALKVIPAGGSSDEDGRVRALREVRAIGRLNSAHIVTLYSVHPPGEISAWLFEMEYVEGGTLNDLIGTDTSLPPDHAVRIASGIASALRAAHEGGIVHGDVKPGNVLVQDDGTIKITDFGLARILGDVSLSLSSSGQLVGTPVYMAPEVVMGERPTADSDVWGLGVILYRMLSGRLPFHATSLNTLFYAIQNTDPPPLEPTVPTTLAQLTLLCLAKAPEDRPTSCGEILAWLEPTRAPEPEAAPARSGRSRHLFGRDEELKALARHVASAERGDGSAVLLSGDAGMGKTALARQTAQQARARGIRWIEAAVTPLEGVLRPLLQSVRAVLDAEEPSPMEADPHASTGDLVRKLLTDGSGSRSQTVWALEQLLKGLAEDRRLALLLEDAQQADAGDLRLVRYLIQHLPEAGILLLITCRTRDPEASRSRPEDPTHIHELAAIEDVTHLELEPLSRAATLSLIEERAGGDAVAPEVCERILSVAEGNPLFVIELLRHLEETGAVARADGVLRPGPQWEMTSLPRRFHELVTYALEGLAEGERALLDVAAVDGLDFDGEAVAAVGDLAPLVVLRQLQRIYRERGIILPSATGYRFASAVFQEVIYTDLAPELRRATHLQLARHLETRGDVNPERLGIHWERAGHADKAMPQLLRAAQEAAGRQEYMRVIRCANRCGLVPGRTDRATLAANAEAVFALASSFLAVGQGDRAATLLEELLEGAGGDLRLRALVRLSHIRYQAHGLDGIDESGVEDAAGQLPRCLEKGRAHYLMGVMAKNRSRLADAERRFLDADAVFRALDLDAQLASALDQLASVAMLSGRTKEAEGLYGDAARIALHAGQRANAAASEVARALAAFQRGALDGLRLKLQGCVQALTLEGARNLAAHARVALAEVRYALGDRREAEEAVDAAMATLVETRYLPGLVPARLQKAHLAAVRGALDDGFSSLRLAEEDAARTEDHELTVRAAALAAQLHAWNGDPSAAAESARRCLEQVDERNVGGARQHVHLMLAEAVLYGMAPDGLVLQGPAARMLAALRQPSPDTLQAAADALAHWPSGERRFVRRILALHLAAESARLGGFGPSAAEKEAEAARLAGRLGHVWLQRLTGGSG